MANTDFFGRATRALAEGLQRTIGSVALDDQLRVPSIEQNLIEGVDPSMFGADYRAGGGDELEVEMLQPHSSPALAVNTFARWRHDASTLSLGGHKGYTAVKFEEPCSTGLPGPPAFFDFFARGEDLVRGVEIKSLEYLRSPSEAYYQGFRDTLAEALRDIPDDRKDDPWYSEASRLKQNPQRYRVLFAEQLFKQFIGITHAYPNNRCSLDYLFWEPTNWSDLDRFRAHREELEAFSGVVEGSAVSFRYQSFAELWTEWSGDEEPEWLQDHVTRLEARYNVAIA